MTVELSDVSDKIIYEIQVRKIVYSRVPENLLITKKDILTESFCFQEKDFKNMSANPEISLCGLNLTIEVQDE